MTTRTKEEQQLLDEKIARIQKKNEEILRRRKEVEEDKRQAEQQNAVVKLRPSATPTDRERTPALKPSRRELREFSDENCEPVVTGRSSRGSFRGRGGGVERYRGQGDWKATGPPPDPRSFLYDDERDAPLKDRDEKGDGRKDLNRRRREMEREEFRGGREFERGSQRGGNERKMERGRRGGRGGITRSQEEAWREERMRIDEARIQRQKSADGKWRREWDNEKIGQEPPEDAKYEPRRTNPASEELRRATNYFHSAEHRGPVDSPHGMYRESPTRNRGRGRGRLHPTELEMPLDNIPLEIFKTQESPARKSASELSFGDDLQRPQKFTDVPLPYYQDKNKTPDVSRKIERVGESFKISISNTDAAQSTPKPQRQVNENRGRFRSHPSYSSQSDEDSPRDKGSRSNRRPRSQKYQRGQGKPGTSSTPPIENAGALSAESKPPLPPSKSKINEDEDDGSWEDVTTSGTESFGEELQSTNSTPTKRTDPTTVEPANHQFDKYLEKIGVVATDGSSGGDIRALDEKDIVDQNLEFGKENTSSECISLEVSGIISSTDVSPDDKTSSKTESPLTSSVNCDIIANSTNFVEVKHAIENETESKDEISDKEEVDVLCLEETKTEPSNSFNKVVIVDVVSNVEISLDKVTESDPTKLLMDEKKSAEKTEIGNSSEVNNDKSSVPNDD